MYFQQSVHKINYDSKEYSTRHFGTKALTNADNGGIFFLSDRCSCWCAILTNPPFSFKQVDSQKRALFV